jgi:phosphomannomutase/phosphoglucomutase
MIIPKNIFREYDIRGLAEEELTSEFVIGLGKAYGTYIQREAKDSRVIIGRDNRLSSQRIQQSLIEGLVSTGVEVIDIGLTISPMAYFARLHLNVDGMVMITASHNPKEFNGFKLAHGSGTIYGAAIQKIRTMMEQEDFLTGEGKVSSVDIFPAYRQMLKEKIKIARPLKVVLDCGNGTAGIFAEKVFADWGIEVIGQHNESDGNFPHHNPDPVKLDNIKDLIERVKIEKADLGIGIDGDADRLGVVDEQGGVVWGDMLMILFSRELLSNCPGAKIIVEVKTSQALPDDIVAHGGKPILWKTGHSLIKAKMKEENALLAGEMSGHMFFADEYFGFDDALYSAGRLMRIIAKSNLTLTQLLADAPKYFATPEIRIAVSDDRKFKIVEELKEKLKEKYQVIDVDGARVIFPDGWALVRASNTQAALIVRAEGKTPDALEKIKEIFGRYLTLYPEIKLDWESQGE